MSFSDLRSARKSREAKSFASTPARSQQQDVQSPASSGSSVVGLEEPESKKSPRLVSGLALSGMPPTLEIRETSDSGRGLYAKENFGIGNVLVSLRPHASVLSVPFLDTYCSWCAGPAPETGLKRCTQCRTVWYCNATCQSNDWSMHKMECIALQHWAIAAPSDDVSIPNDAVRCIGRMLWSIRKKGPDSKWAAELNVLQSHRKSLQLSASESYTHLAHSIVRYVDASSPDDLVPYGIRSAGDLVDLISRFTTNAFTLTTSSLAPIGVSYSPVLALANHSCEPNAVIVFPHHFEDSSKEPAMCLISVKPIAPREQVFISYCDTTLPKASRQQVLTDTYNFTCTCDACTENKVTVDPRLSLECPKSCGGRCSLPVQEDDVPRCVQCGALVHDTGAILDAVRIGEEALRKANAVQTTDPAKAKQLTTNMIPILSRAGLTPSSHPLLAMTRLHLEILIACLPTSIDQALLDEAIQTAAKYVAGLSDILPYGHPVRAVASAELGKLLAVDEPAPLEQNTTGHFPPSGPARLKLAYETLLRAHNELLIGFGRGTQGGRVGMEVRNIIVRLEKELGIWTEGIRNVMEDTRAANTITR